MAVFASGVVNLWATIESYGLDPGPLFAAENIKVNLPIDPRLRLPYEKIDRIRARAVKLCGDEAFGLRSAMVYLPSQFGALGYAWQASLTLRRAYLRLQRFVRIANDKAVVEVADRDGCMVVSLRIGAPTVSGFARDDSALAVITRMSRLFRGDHFRLQAVNFIHEEPGDIKPYFEFFGCKLNFGQAENQLFIPLPLADEELTGGNATLAMLNDNVVLHDLAQIDHADIVTRVQAKLIDQLPHGGVNDQSVAEALHMSVRTLRRKLAEVKTSFRSQIVETRRRLAMQYILDDSLTLTEISLLLGFSEQSAFSRAFKSWTGSTPTEMRQARAI
jgi:AraC-like DNA-binding protein